MNVVPLRNDPQVVRFGGTPNIPFGRSKFCKQKTYANAPANARVCYGGIAPDPPEVGNSWTISDDPEDAVFYSTCYRKQTVFKLKGATDAGEEKEDQKDEEPTPPEWRWKDKCISCADAAANAAAP